MEKTLRVLGGGGEDGHAHSHSHSHGHEHGGETEGTASGVASGAPGAANSLRERKSGGEEAEVKEHGEEEEKHAQVSKLSAYLNLFGDFCHNMCVFFAEYGVFFTAHSFCAVRTDSRTSLSKDLLP